MSPLHQAGLADCPRIWFDQIGSTSEEATRRAQLGDHGPIWLVAGEQSAARGRRGRSWASPKGNLFATALFPFHGSLSEASRVCFAAGLALIDALEALTPVRGFRLKWPNDVQHGPSKLAGILIETGRGAREDSSCSPMWMSIGIGVNLVSAPIVAGRETTSLVGLGGPELAPLDVVSHLGQSLDHRIGQLLGSGFEGIRADWLSRAYGMDSMMNWNVGDQVKTGRFAGIDDEGAAILIGSGGDQFRVTAGDVSVVNEVGR
jgi:BirA family transcriptional regulator, biotin operon repressor / biotin---[acetyl-CoA-carboxylase] ligase